MFLFSARNSSPSFSKTRALNSGITFWNDVLIRLHNSHIEKVSGLIPLFGWNFFIKISIGNFFLSKLVFFFQISCCMFILSNLSRLDGKKMQCDCVFSLKLFCHWIGYVRLKCFAFIRRTQNVFAFSQEPVRECGASKMQTFWWWFQFPWSNTGRFDTQQYVYKVSEKFPLHGNAD